MTDQAPADQTENKRNFVAELDAAEDARRFEFMAALKEACTQKWKPMLDKILTESARVGATGITSYHDILGVSLAHGGGEDNIPEYHQCYVRIRVPAGVRNSAELAENVVSLMNEGATNPEYMALPGRMDDGSFDIRVCVTNGSLALMGDDVAKRFNTELPELRSAGRSAAG